jgi:hypothetical protein
MSFTACFWKSWRIKENHVEFWGRIYLQISWVPPWHLQANIFPFTHAYWWQNHIAFVWIFRFLVSPSSKKLKNTFPDWKTTRIITFLVLRAFVCICGHLRGICGRFAGCSCRKICLSVVFVIFANHYPFRIHRMPQSSSVLCGADLDLPNASVFSKHQWFELIANKLLYQSGRPKSCRMAANRFKPWE